MGIDITRIKSEDLLSVLGKGNWEIILHEGYPDLVITPAWRHEVFQETACDFIRWVLGGTRIVISHENDPAWDHSGTARQVREDSLHLRVRYKTLGEWLENEHTGHSIASFVSGCGLFWETYQNVFDDRVDEMYFNLVKDHLRGVVEEDSELWDDLIDESFDLEIWIKEALSLWIGSLHTKEAWILFSPLVQARLEEERRQADIRRMQDETWRWLSRDFWQRYFKDVDNKKPIEMPQFKALKLGERLAEALLDADPEIARAIAEVGLPGIFSNSVKAAITHYAQEALKE